MAENDYGPKTGAADDHPYNSTEDAERVPAVPAGKDKATPPDNHTEIDSEADLDDPSGR